MHNSKIILLLKTFTDKEFREFNKFLASPYYNQKQEIIRLYQEIRKTAPEFLEKKIQRKQIMKKVFPQESFSEKKYKYVSNLLLKLAEKYISLKETESRELIQEYHLLNAYTKRDVEKNYNFILSKTKKEHSLFIKRDADYYYQDYLLKNVEEKYFNQKKIRKNNKYTQQLLDSFDIYYLANKLKYTCHLINDQQIISSTSDFKLMTEIIQFIDKENYSDYPAIHLYFVLYRLLTEDDKKYFDQIKILLSNYNNLFDKEELRGINYIVINFCIKKLRLNERTDFYLRELYQMYQNGIASNLLFEGNYLSPWTYKNVIKLGLRLELFQETEQFIIQYKDKLKQEFQSNAFHYNMGELHYYKKDFSKALDYLLYVDFSDIYYILGTKSLMLKIYYETDEDEALFSLMASFQTYLRRNTLLSEEIRITYSNFIKCLQKITKEPHQKLLDEINNTAPLYDQKWLLEKLNKKL